MRVQEKSKEKKNADLVLKLFSFSHIMLDMAQTSPPITNKPIIFNEQYL